MHKVIKQLAIAFTLCSLTSVAIAQNKTQHRLEIHQLPQVRITGIRTVNGTGHHQETYGDIIYAGKKNEVLVIDSMDANKAINNTRQILGRIPGLNIVETETGGFTANGIGFRGLNPIQSKEVNVRQNGYNISGDVYGYNEAYYVPPMEAVERVETIRGAASLQYGAQFGGMVNYVLKGAPKDKPFELVTSQTGGSHGLFNSFNSLGGHYKRWSYYGFVQYRHLKGWRPNSPQTQLTGYGKIGYKAGDKLMLGLEYSLLRNRIKMPGGLTDEEFDKDPRASFRPRNWLTTPWNILAATLDYKWNENTELTIKSAFQISARNLVWRNEDGGPAVMDTINPQTNQYDPREVERENMKSNSTEIRLMTSYPFLSHKSTLAVGMRLAYTDMIKKSGGEGTTGSDFDMHVNGAYEKDMHFATTNLAPYAENIFHLTDHFTVTPGIRLEYLKSKADGYATKENTKLSEDTIKRRYFVLLGIGLQYGFGQNTNAYANISQSYKPITYSQLTPFGTTSRIDPNMKDADGYQVDLGYRGTVKNLINFDVSGFYLVYNNRIGVIQKTDQNGGTYTLRTNVANSVNKGIEEYIELNITNWLFPSTHIGNISVFNSLALVDARYTSGEYKGKKVEYAPDVINRIGMSYGLKRFSGTFTFSQQSKSYGDASNVERGRNDDPVVGAIPAYHVMDISLKYKFNRFALKAGITNMADQHYFTFRTDEYPGPGIIPADGRSFYMGISAKL
jgi:Fe(3+) dicitrate transport protein